MTRFGRHSRVVDAAPDVMHRGTRFPPDPPVCSDSDDRESRAERVRATTVGLMESLTDRCDEDGNLIDHRCEILPSTDCEPCTGECSPCVEHTGRVIEAPFDCNGGCVDGACPNWCPEQGDEIVITEDTASGGLRVDNLTKGNHVLCTPNTDGTPEAHCANLAGYLGEQVYEFSTDCYGAAPSSLLLDWALASSSVDGPGKCFVDCTRGVE